MMHPELTEPLGIFQSDVIVRTAIIAALEDLRKNPWLLDYVFASLKHDGVTKNVYGQKEIDQAKEWFLSTDIRVLMSTRVPEGAPPAVCVTVQLGESDEAENTLADVHYKPKEDTTASWPPLTSSFTPVSYNHRTGRFVLPARIGSEVSLSTSMVVVDREGNIYPIESVTDSVTCTIPTGLNVDFRQCVLKAAGARHVANLEGASFKESYVIGCHIVGEPVHLTYLHSIVVFCLLRYRERLLEARGFGRTKISSTDIKMHGGAEMPEMFFSRYITLSGFVHQYWPKDVSERVLTFASQPVVSSASQPSTAREKELDPGDDLWLGADVLGRGMSGR